MEEGRIIKLIGGLYTIIDHHHQSHERRPLGILRYQNVRPIVGDKVLFDADSLISIRPRTNELVRPQIANVDQALLIHSAKAPDFSFALLDRFLILIEQNHIVPVIIVTKIDLLQEQELNELKKKLQYYECFYRVIYVSNKQHIGISEIVRVTENKINVLAGQTGAGKSSLLNAINPDLNIKTDVISKALGRGKHTTRHVELIPFESGWIADTPGFSKLAFPQMDSVSLKDRYPDFVHLSSQCSFNECTHIHEPGCKVIEAYHHDEIPRERYQNYVRFFQEIKATKPQY